MKHAPPFNSIAATGAAEPEAEINLRLARLIERRWRDAGWSNVRCTLEPVSEGGRTRWGGTLYTIRSNLVNGMPPQ